MAVADDLQAAYANVAANLKKITASPQPSYSIDGESWSWESLFNSYTAALKELARQIQEAQGPVEIRSRATT